jgi:hypothetical protein
MYNCKGDDKKNGSQHGWPLAAISVSNANILHSLFLDGDIAADSMDRHTLYC